MTRLEGLSVQLSRRGWNNVLIFAILAMMLIFQYSGKKVNGDDTANLYQSALPASAVVLSMQFDHIQIQRVGSQLATKPELGLSQPQLQQIIKAWESATFKPVAKDVVIANLAYGINVSFELANLAEPVTLILYQIESGYLLQNWQSQLLQIDEAELQVLLPR